MTLLPESKAHHIPMKTMTSNKDKSDARLPYPFQLTANVTEPSQQMPHKRQALAEPEHQSLEHASTRFHTPQHHAPVQPQPRLQHSTHRRTATETPNPTKHEPSLIPTQKQTERKPHTRTNNNSARQQNPVPKPYSKTARPHNNNGARRPPWTSARRGPEDGLDWA